MKRLEENVEEIKEKISFLLSSLVPYFRRIIRFFALPYAFVFMVDWDECNIGKIQVTKDFFYIFFHLKYYPDNYSSCRLWEIKREEWKFFYGSNYDPYQRGKLRRFVQPKKYEILYEDKQVCYQLCKAANIPLPVQYATVSAGDNYIKIFNEIFKRTNGKKFIIKPTLGRAGIDIHLIFKKANEIFIKNNRDTFPLEKYKIDFPFVVQEYVNQHENLREISRSVNTIRLVTLLTKENEVVIVGAYMRFGSFDSFTDNVSSGGVAVEIDISNGRLSQYAFDKIGRKYTKHKISNFEYNNFKIPFWEEVVNLGKATQNTLPYFKLLGHDIAVTDTGPIIIEINAIYDNVALEQRCGPILKNKNVLKIYGDYDLLINKFQHQLYRRLF
jgi:hypothetical protein